MSTSPFFSVKVTRRDFVLFDQLLNARLVFRMVGSVTLLLEVLLGNTDVVAEHVRQTVASGIVNQRAGIGMNIFERNPRGGQVPEGIRGHVDGIGMKPLLRTLMRRDGLQRLRFAIQQQTQGIEKAGVFQNPAESPRFFMRIQIAAGPGISLARGFCRELDSTRADCLFVAFPNGVECGGIEKILDDDVAIRVPVAADVCFVRGNLVAS